VAGGLGGEALEGIGRGGLGPEVMAGECAVVVAAAGGHQAEPGRQHPEAAADGGRMVRVPYLEAGQARSSQRADLIVGHLVAAGAGVGQHADPAGLADQGDRVGGIEGVLVLVGPAAVADPVGGEGVGGRTDRAGVGQRAGDVRAADHPVAGDRGDLFPRHPGAEGGQLGHHDPGPADPVVADAGHRFGQRGISGVEQVGQQMQGQPGRQRGPGLVVSGHGVVVGQRHHVQTAGPGAGHHLGGRVCAVRGAAVRVQVDAHPVMLRR
jgi:hypothetical protein